jgi:hypothetical protein
MRGVLAVQETPPAQGGAVLGKVPFVLALHVEKHRRGVLLLALKKPLTRLRTACPQISLCFPPVFHAASRTEFSVHGFKPMTEQLQLCFAR